MQHTLQVAIASNNITSTPFDSDELAEIATQNLLENWGLNVMHMSSNRSLVTTTNSAKEDGILYSDIFDTKEKALVAQKIMLTDWGLVTEIKPYDSEPIDDGYDMDKYY